MDGFVTKPFRPADILAAVERFAAEAEITETTPDLAERQLDTTRLRDQVVDERELFEEIAGMFFGQKDEILTDLADAIEREDARTIERRAHRLKGTLGNLAAEAAAEAAERLEKIGRQGCLDAVGPAFAELRIMTEDVTAELKQLLATGFPEEQNG
jgi:HPt (histidine-containing phosphotransfer) domain-containing protein